MESDHYFDSANEALAFCRELTKAGTADLFRGQTKDWPRITPSLFRGDDLQREKAVAILTQFIEWANAVPQMGRYWGDDQQIIAIAQHYGIPTPYLDLTTDPETAAIFAAVSSESAPNVQAVIYCFRRDDLKNLPAFALHELDVANLWRLKAQKGLFLEVLTESDVDLLRAFAIRVHFPARLLREDERRTIYPPRKSALEIVIDQWVYRHMIADMLGGFSDSSRRFMIRRYTYPGIARWRAMPEFAPGWMNWEVGWVFQDDNEVISPGSDSRRQVALPRGLSIHETFNCLEARISAILDRYRTDKQPFDFEIVIDHYPVESPIATELLNRCWDGLRVHPYPEQSIVRCLATTAVALLWRLEHPETDWEKLLWGEIKTIDVAPIGGHLDSAMVSRKSLMGAFHDSYHGILTAYARRRVAVDPLFLTNYVVDPWVLFDFGKFARMFVEEFIPSCIGWYWKSCLEGEDRQLSDLWAISFNPALLGFVTLSSYRFHSPIATEVDVDHVVLISSDMDEDDIEETFISCLPAILSGSKPFTVKFTDYSADAREIWEIDEVIEQCQMIVRIGGISVLDVIPGVRDFDTPKERHPRDIWEGQGLGALHIWAIANNRLTEINGVPFAEIQDLFQVFWRELLESNAEIERRGRNQPDWPG
ncbi:FRG domain-containing protein [Microvirga puerhi]|uniref:FRG domain-containing protein n=1 Tax=Microvirga puerhi TaxID=2876078 RepID=A0ABS7VP56_9HYPH|nr:FRG domain-containing protein [Microvirga puerhi]MBZ6076885.1 FRG domain-containing protein [Microvirga puerhi]